MQDLSCSGIDDEALPAPDDDAPHQAPLERAPIESWSRQRVADGLTALRSRTPLAQNDLRAIGGLMKDMQKALPSWSPADKTAALQAIRAAQGRTLGNRILWNHRNYAGMKTGSRESHLPRHTYLAIKETKAMLKSPANGLSRTQEIFKQRRELENAFFVIAALNKLSRPVDPKTIGEIWVRPTTEENEQIVVRELVMKDMTDYLDAMTWVSPSSRSQILQRLNTRLEAKLSDPAFIFSLRKRQKFVWDEINAYAERSLPRWADSKIRKKLKPFRE